MFGLIFQNVYKEIEREEMYIRYVSIVLVHHLFVMTALCQVHVSKGLRTTGGCLVGNV